MGEHQLLKYFCFLDDVRLVNEELLIYYNHFNKNLTDIDQVISEGEVIRAFIKDLGTKGTAMKDNHQGILIYNQETLAEMLKSYRHGNVERARVGA